MEKPYSWSWVEHEAARTVAAWENCARRPWPGGPRFSRQEQKIREKAYDEGLRAVERETRKAPRTKADRLDAQRRVVAVFPGFAATVLGLEEGAVDLLTRGFLPAGTELARWAKRFDPGLSTADLVQACRNTWTACGIQSLMGQPMRLTPSILGYSLLYPYSDNYLDQAEVSGPDKLEFSMRFRDRLRGQKIRPHNPREAAMWAMVQLIEGEYPRAQFPQVYDCLLAIHKSQERSLAQLKGSTGCGDSELLQISCAKGGTSVLADACLVRGWLNEDESRFAFEWGALLQLGDDLQDVREDLERGSASLFSRAASTGWPLDELVTQLLNFSDRVAERMESMPEGSPTLKGLLRMSWRNLILMAVAGTQELFSRAFLAGLETSSPFRLDFIRRRNRKLAQRQSLYPVLFEAFLEVGEGDSDRFTVSVDQMEPSMGDEGGTDAKLAAMCNFRG